MVSKKEAPENNGVFLEYIEEPKDGFGLSQGQRDILGVDGLDISSSDGADGAWDCKVQPVENRSGAIVCPSCRDRADKQVYKF